MKKLNEIIDCNLKIDISGITDDSRSVEKGFLFVATKGFNVDHYDYIEDAIKNGCSCVITDRKINIEKEKNEEKNIPYIIVENINEKYYELCAKFYDIDLDKFSFIGITGTDGKTTSTTIIKNLISNLYKTTYIGTNGAEIGKIHMKTNNTTPIIPELYSVLSCAKKEKCKNISVL